MNDFNLPSGTQPPAGYPPPPPLDFDFPSAPTAAPAPAPLPPKPQSRLQRMQGQGGIMGALATLLVLLAKFGGVVLGLLLKLKGLLVGLKFLTFGKFLITGGSLIINIVVEAAVFGWAFAVGITMLILFHECGHAIAAHRKGIGWSFMLFIPFMGAMVATKRYGKSLADDAYIGIMGPVFGAIAGIFCVLMYPVTGSIFWLYLARLNFMMNLFNLLPTPPLDGGWIAPVFSPKLLALGVVLLFVVGVHNPMIWILALMSLPRIISGWKADPATQPYYQVKPGDRWIFAVSYIGLAAFLAISGFMLTGWIMSVRHMVF